MASVDSFDEGMEVIFEQYSDLELAKIELSMLVFEMTDIEAIFAKFHEVDNKVADLQKTIAQAETLSEGMNSQKVSSRTCTRPKSGSPFSATCTA